MDNSALSRTGRCQRPFIGVVAGRGRSGQCHHRLPPVRQPVPPSPPPVLAAFLQRFFRRRPSAAPSDRPWTCWTMALIFWTRRTSFWLKHGLPKSTPSRGGHRTTVVPTISVTRSSAEGCGNWNPLNVSPSRMHSIFSRFKRAKCTCVGCSHGDLRVFTG